ncbi:hypothetical protein [Marinobacter sp.]|jgi:hypothetical protein|uniref:hypothetical protein n=1 Tax=Marinobacter sp. TaxID=50741 RepID=UPI000C98C6B6|nr:hypothetical protein [Marinobacter sp.]MAK50925.1 hypothetical protein [Marinobacter sp.]|tara:strand:- start:1035 stop:1262 length:228 start_codon:yes stop_codon:yes gene_type:complete
MKIVKNTSMQGLSIPFGAPDGIKTIFLAPKQQIEVPETWKSSVAENLVHRRMVKIKIVSDPVIVKAPVKKTRKSN